jgi:hypothetical protein
MEIKIEMENEIESLEFVQYVVRSQEYCSSAVHSKSKYSTVEIEIQNVESLEYVRYIDNCISPFKIEKEIEIEIQYTPYSRAFDRLIIAAVHLKSKW